MKKIIIAVSAIVLTVCSFGFTSHKSAKKEACCYAGSPCCEKGSSCCKSK